MSNDSEKLQCFCQADCEGSPTQSIGRVFGFVNIFHENIAKVWQIPTMKVESATKIREKRGRCLQKKGRPVCESESANP